MGYNGNQPYYENQPMNNQYQENYPYQENIDMYQQRLNNMANQLVSRNNMRQGYNPNQPMMGVQNAPQGMPQPQQRYNIRAVTGIEEVIASPAPFDGSISIFTDFSHGKIYTKQLNMSDGTASMRSYTEEENPAPSATAPANDEQYVKRSEFDDLKSKFDTIYSALTAPEKENAPAPKQNKKEETK